MHEQGKSRVSFDWLVDRDVSAVATAGGEPTMLGALLVAVLGLACIVGAVRAWRRRHRIAPDVPRSERLSQSAAAFLVFAVGLMLVTIAAWSRFGDGALPNVANYAIFGAFLAVGGLLAVSGSLRLWEARADRRLRAQMGLSTLRRRVHWAVPVVVWFFAYPFVFVGLLWAAANILVALGQRPDVLFPDPSNSTALTAMFGGTFFGGLVVLGTVQAYRRRRRDREIQDSDLAATQLEFTVDERPPVWMPTAFGRSWMTWQRTLDAPVPDGKSRQVIAEATAGVLALVAILAVLTLTPLADDVLPIPGGQAIWALLSTIASAAVWWTVVAPSTTTGLRTALRSRRTHRLRDPSEEGPQTPE